MTKAAESGPRPQAVCTSKAAPAGGHYSQGVVHAGLLYISEQLPVCPVEGHRPETSFEDQAHVALSNLLAILAEAGGTPDDLLKVTVYLVGVDHWPAFNAIYADLLGDARPARSIVPVPELHYGYLVEVDAVARF